MIFIIRHGQTDLNRAHVLQGRSNYPLNEKGTAQAEKAAVWFRENGIVFSHVFSSPLDRAVRTAAVCAPDMNIITDERLTEMDYGPYEGTDLKSPPPEIVSFFRDFVRNPAPCGMEQLREVRERTGEFLREVSGLSGNILVSTHAIAMKGLLENLDAGAEGKYWSRYIGNCAVFGADHADGRFGRPLEMYPGT